MNLIRKFLMWCWLLTKRLYKKPTFVGILILIPVLVLGYSMVAGEESGMLTIALAREDNEDPMASQVVAEIRQSSQLIRFIDCESPEEAEKLVETGKADSAWVFKEDMRSRVYRFVARPSSWNSFVRIIEREETVPLMLAREKLTGAVFACTSEVLYLSYLREHVPELDALSDEELLSYYDAMLVEGDLFEFSYIDSGKSTESAQNSNYLLTPVRGLLAVVVMLCGMATAMYYVQDSQLGTFGWIPERRRPLVEFGCQMISVGNVSVVMLICLAIVGTTVSIGRELLMLVMYCACASLFCMVLRRLIGGLRGLGMLLPLLTVVMLVVCPVFFDLGALREAQYLFPPTYYINAPYSDKFLLYMPVYAIALMAMYCLVGKISKRK